jgi:RimJ/RimL family protein N-acetyltransferase
MSDDELTMNRLELHTERLRLRLINRADLLAIQNLHSLPETDRFNTLGIPKNIEETQNILEDWISQHQHEEKQRYVLAVEIRPDLQFVGLAGFNVGQPKYQRAELWYKIDPAFWGQGIATETLCMLLDFGFNHLRLHRIEAGCAVENVASIKVLEKGGLKREGRRRKILPLKTGWSDNFEYAILDTDHRVEIAVQILT